MAAQIVSYKSRIINDYYYIHYNPDNDSNEPLTGNQGIANGKFIRDVLLSYGWRPNQIVGAVCSAQRWAFMNPAKGFPMATTGGFFNRSTQALQNVWHSRFGTEKYGYGDAPLMLIQGQVAENSGFNYPYGDGLTWVGYLAGNYKVGEMFEYFWVGYCSGQTLDPDFAAAQGRYWRRILFGVDDEGEGNPDTPPTGNPEGEEAHKDWIKKHIVVPFLIFGRCGNIGCGSGSRRKTYLRGDCT